MRNTILFWAFCLFVAGASSCNSAPQEAANHTKTYPVIIPKGDDGREDFSIFYEKFHGDSSFQLERIKFPLEGLPPADTVLASDEQFYWRKDDWTLHKRIDLSNPNIKHKIKDFEFMMVEVISIQDKMFIERRFVLSPDDEWFLMFYSGTQPGRDFDASQELDIETQGE